MITKGLLTAMRQRQIRELLSHVEQAVQGTLVETYRACGKPGCACSRGAKHGPYYLLTWSEGGKAKARHVPREKAALVRAGVEHYRRAQAALMKIGAANRRILLEVSR